MRSTSHPTFKIFVVILTLYVALSSFVLVFPSYIESPLGWLLRGPLVSLMVVEHIGLLAGWCSPWLVVVGIWLGLAWAVAWLVATVRKKFF